jgi:integrase
VDQLTDWQRIINREAITCSPKTLKNAWGFVRSVVEDVTGQFPPSVKLPAPIQPDKPFLTPDQIKVFVEAVKDTQYAVPSLLALSSLRASEIEALDWKDIPNKPQFIRVSGAVVLNEENKMVRKKSNKNTTSTRNVPVMIPELLEALERDRKPSGPVIGMHQSSLREGIDRICKKSNLPQVGIHGLRHSFASLAYHLQIPEKIAMEIGGWSDSTTMQKIYTHIAKSDITRYQTKMFDFFSGKADEINANGK